MTWKLRKTRNGRWTVTPTATTMSRKLRKILNSTKHSLILIFNFLFVKGNSHVIMPGVRALQKILMKEYGVCVGIRWIYQCLRDLENLGLIRRKTRPRVDKEGKFRSLSSMIVFTVSGVMYLKQSLIEGSTERWRKTLEWLKRNDRRFPSESELIGDGYQDLISRNLYEIRKILKDLG